MEQTRKPNLFTLLFVTVFSFASIFYIIIATNTGNLRWFLPNSEFDKPTRIIISDYGERKIITAEHSEYQLLADAVNESISDLDNTDLVPIGLSATTIEDYESKSFVIEVHYPRPISFNTLFRTGNPTKILIPIEGRHSKDRLFFRGKRDEWWFGGMRMVTANPIYDVLNEVGYPEITNPNS